MQCLETMYFTPILRSDDCIFNPVSKARGRQGREEEKEYNVQLSPMQVGCHHEHGDHCHDHELHFDGGHHNDNDDNEDDAVATPE